VKGKLYVVATPIGNLSDITQRAKEILKSSPIILTEDTRKTGWLLKSLKIENKQKIYAFNKDNEFVLMGRFIKELLRGIDVVLISNAGTPLISDPGSQLVKYAQDKDIKVIPVPGPSSLCAALSVTGIKLGSFVFMGFIPKKESEIIALFDASHNINKVEKSIKFFISFISSHNINRLLKVLTDYFPAESNFFLAQEMTKINENISWVSSSELKKIIGKKAKGEYVFGWLIDNG
jgi:16S rRNA (cytidine1402-2'-O)-methyltransferase